VSNLAAVMEAGAAEGGWAGDVAFIAGDRCVTHAEVHRGAARTGALLVQAGVGRGDRVVIAMPDGVEFVWAFIGALRIGAVAVPVNPRLSEADHRVAGAGSRAVVCNADLAGRFKGTVLLDEELEGAAAALPPAPAAEVTGEDAAYAQFTSGTTGVPKEARHGHSHPPVYVAAFARPAIAIRRTDVLLSVSKLYFAYGLGNSLFFPLLTGCRAVLHAGHPRPDDIADLVARHQVTVLFSVPTFYAHLVAGARAADMASVRVAVSAGEALGVELAARARAFLGCPILDGLGSTEVGQTFASNTSPSAGTAPSVAPCRPTAWTYVMASCGLPARHCPSATPASGSAPATGPCSTMTDSCTCRDGSTTSSRWGGYRSPRWKSRTCCAAILR
jgi:4-hydroxybenzoate adenylyltransferase